MALQTVNWADRRLFEIVRFLVRGGPNAAFNSGDYEVLLCLGRLRAQGPGTGELVTVKLPFEKLPAKSWLEAMLPYAKKDGIHLGEFDFMGAFSFTSGMRRELPEQEKRPLTRSAPLLGSKKELLK